MFSAEKSDHNPIPPEFWGVFLGLDYRYWVSEERRPKANSSNYFRTNLTYTTTVHQRHRLTDGQTDRGTTYDSSIELCTTCIAR